MTDVGCGVDVGSSRVCLEGWWCGSDEILGRILEIFEANLG